jgi:hypothetical protein
MRRKPLPAGYVVFKLLNAGIDWPQPHPDLPVFGRIRAPVRLRALLLGLLLAVLFSADSSEAALFPRFACTLKMLGTAGRIR